MQEKTKKQWKNITHIHIGKNKGRTEKHYLYLYEESRRKNRETKAIFIQGKTREKLKNISHVHIGRTREEPKNITYICTGKDKGRMKNISHSHIEKDKGRTEKHYLCSYRKRQEQHWKTFPILIWGKTRERQRNKRLIHMRKDKGRIREEQKQKVKNETLFSKKRKEKKRKRRKTFCGVTVNCLTQFTTTHKHRKGKVLQTVPRVD